MSVQLFLLVLLGLYSLSSSTNFYERTFVRLPDTRLLHTGPPISAASACHCKMLCSLRPGCVGVTFLGAERMCAITDTGTAEGVVLVQADGDTTWLKHNFTYKASNALEVAPSFFLTNTTTRSATLDGLTIMCAAEGGSPANLRTEAQKEEFLRVMMNASSSAWMPISARGEVLEWQNGSPILSFEWLIVAVNAVSGPMVSGIVRTSGKVYMKDMMVSANPLLCARPPPAFLV